MPLQHTVTRPPKKIHLFWANLSYIPAGPCHAGYPLEFQHLMNVGYFFGFFVKGLPCHRAFKVGISRMQQSQKSFEPYYIPITSFDLFAIYLAKFEKILLSFNPWYSWILTGHVPVQGQTNPSGFSRFWALSPYISLNEAVLLQCKPREANSTMYGVSESYKRALLFQFFFVQPGSFFGTVCNGISPLPHKGRSFLGSKFT